jgi:hypothetical protein
MLMSRFTVGTEGGQSQMAYPQNTTGQAPIAVAGHGPSPRTGYPHMPGGDAAGRWLRSCNSLLKEKPWLLGACF